MKSPLFKKLFGTFSLTILVSFSLFGAMLFNVFDTYFLNNRVDTLTKQGQQLVQTLQSYLRSNTYGNVQSFINDQVEMWNKYLGAKVWYVNAANTILAPDVLVGTKVDMAQEDELRHGRPVIYKHAFDNLLNQAMLTVAYPVVLDNQYYGAYLVHSDLAEIKGAARSIFENIFLLIILTMGIFYVVLFFLSKRITTPLGEISDAAKEIASGQFEKRLDIHTKDEIEELSKSFNNMAASLEKIEENRRHFIANISHDLRSPMTSIQGFVEGILDGTIPPDKRDYYLDIVLNESKRLMKITNELLELNNIQHGITTPQKTTFELCELIRRKVLSFESQIMKKKIEVEIFWPEKDMIMVYSDVSYVERILTNLIDNAVKFTPEGGTLIIRLVDLKTKAQLSVENSGVTMSDEEMNHIWERFHKGDSSRGKDKLGFGLGLSIVREMIVQLGEKITAVSENHMVKFTFTLCHPEPQHRSDENVQK